MKKVITDALIIAPEIAFPSEFWYTVFSIPAKPLLCMLTSGGFFFPAQSAL